MRAERLRRRRPRQRPSACATCASLKPLDFLRQQHDALKREEQQQTSERRKHYGTHTYIRLPLCPTAGMHLEISPHRPESREGRNKRRRLNRMNQQNLLSSLRNRSLVLLMEKMIQVQGLTSSYLLSLLYPRFLLGSRRYCAPALCVFLAIYPIQKTAGENDPKSIHEPKDLLVP